jgi:Tetratricopeptide repeat.
MFGFKRSLTKQSQYDKLVEVDTIYMNNRANVIVGWRALNNNYLDEKAKAYENLCRNNILQYYAWIREGKKNKNFKPPTQVDAFKYLAMLYEKQGRYEEAIAICDEAIATGATYDGTKNGMNGRKNKLQKKIQV